MSNFGELLKKALVELPEYYSRGLSTDNWLEQNIITPLPNLAVKYVDFDRNEHGIDIYLPPNTAIYMDDMSDNAILDEVEKIFRQQRISFRYIIKITTI